MDEKDVERRGRPAKRNVPAGAVYPCDYCQRDEGTCRYRLCKDYRAWTKAQWKNIQETLNKLDTEKEN